MNERLAWLETAVECKKPERVLVNIIMDSFKTAANG